MYSKNNLKAYSMLEILITMAIFAILSTMLLQSVFLNIQLGNNVSIRTRIRSELDQITALMERDFRNADYFVENTCNDILKGTTETYKSCQMQHSNDTVEWRYYVTSATKAKTMERIETPAAGTPSVTFKTDTSFYQIENMNFDVNYSQDVVDLSGVTPYATILVTLNASYKYSSCDAENDTIGSGICIRNQVKQLSVSTRNYNIR